jgi:hypothetical protein
MPRSKYRLEATDRELCCCGSKEGTRAIKWESILEIQGFKRDQITTDLLCLTINYRDGAENAVEINEEMDGFADAEKVLARLGFLRSDWRKLVVLPPFQSRKFVLFSASKK